MPALQEIPWVLHRLQWMREQRIWPNGGSTSVLTVLAVRPHTDRINLPKGVVGRRHVAGYEHGIQGAERPGRAV